MAKEKWSSRANRWFNPLRPGSNWFDRGMALSNDVTAAIMAAGFFKDGGRVRPKGCGKAKRGFGRAMKRKR